MDVRVMVIDEDRDYRRAVCAQLEDKHFVCEAFDAVLAALTGLVTFAPDVVIVGLGGPKVEPLVDVIAELRPSSHPVGVVGVSDEHAVHPLADAVVPRQASVDELVRAVLFARDSAQLGRG